MDEIDLEAEFKFWIFEVMRSTAVWSNLVHKGMRSRAAISTPALQRVHS